MRGVGVVLAVLLGGCHFYDEEPEQPDRCFPEAAIAVDPAGTESVFVVDAIQFPSTPEQAQYFGLDLDCDPRRRPDNDLANIANTVALPGDDLSREMNRLIQSGEMLFLVEVKTTSFDDAASVGVRLLYGEDRDGDLSDNFSGSEYFGVNASLGEGALSGRAQDGVITAEHGTIPFLVTFPGIREPFILSLTGARVELEQTETGLSGRIAGAVSKEYVESTLAPVVAESLRRKVTRDCGADRGPPPNCCNGEDNAGAFAIAWFDDCSMWSQTCDCDISADEVLNNPFLSPDVDLFDEEGQFNPRTDEVKESLSFGVGFTAVGAHYLPQ